MEHKIWQQYYPFYLDYYEEIQLTTSIVDLEWIKNYKPNEPNSEWRQFGILLHTTDKNISKLELMEVLFPSENNNYSPEELLQCNTQRNHKLKVLESQRQFQETISLIKVFSTKEQSVGAVFTDNGNLHLFNIGNGRITENQKIVGNYSFNLGVFSKEYPHQLILFDENQEGTGVLDFEKSEIINSPFQIVSETPMKVEISHFNQSLLGILSKTGTIEIIDMKDNKTLHKNYFFKAHNNIVVDFSFCDKNEYIFASADENEIAFWDLRNLSQRCFTIHSKDLLAMQFFQGPYLQILASSGNKIQLIDLKSQSTVSQNSPFEYNGHVFENIQFW